MSHLRDVPGLAELVAKHNLKVFVETGTGDGDGLRTARDLGLAQRFSCDLNHRARQCHDLGHISLSDSVGFLKCFSGLYGDRDEPLPCLFWLDAHFPEKFGCKGDPWPLPRELAVILKKKWISKDVIICDDMHCIQDPANPTREDGPGHDWEPVEGTVAALIEPFLRTHTATLQAVGTGILVLEPRI